MNKSIEKQIGSNIRLIRENKKIIQDELATKLQIAGCDITRSAIAKIEVGQRHIYSDEIVLIKKFYTQNSKTYFMVQKRSKQEAYFFFCNI